MTEHTKPDQWTANKFTAEVLKSIKLKVIATSEFDPRKPESMDELLENQPANYLQLLQWCQREKIYSANGLTDAPRELRALIQDPKMRPHVLKLLFWL